MTERDWRADFEKEKKDQEAIGSLLYTYAEGKPESGAAVRPYIQQIIKDALSSGYGVYRERLEKSVSNPLFLQKCIRGAPGVKLYFINIGLWDLRREFGSRLRAIDHQGPGVDLTPNAQFYVGERRGSNARTVDISCHLTNDDTLRNIEVFFTSFYSQMGCVPYEDYE